MMDYISNGANQITFRLKFEELPLLDSNILKFIDRNLKGSWEGEAYSMAWKKQPYLRAHPKKALTSTTEVEAFRKDTYSAAVQRILKILEVKLDFLPHIQDEDSTEPAFQLKFKAYFQKLNLLKNDILTKIESKTKRRWRDGCLVYYWDGKEFTKFRPKVPLRTKTERIAFEGEAHQTALQKIISEIWVSLKFI